jgi:hypothetical protein
MASDTFELFPKFPLEIRRAIWLHALPRVQNLLTLKKRDALAQESRTRSRRVTRYFEQDPVALWVNFESSEVAIRHYVMEMDYFPQINRHADFNLDTFVFNFGDFFNFSRRPIFRLQVR